MIATTDDRLPERNLKYDSEPSSTGSISIVNAVLVSPSLVLAVAKAAIGTELRAKRIWVVADMSRDRSGRPIFLRCWDLCQLYSAEEVLMSLGERNVGES